MSQKDTKVYPALEIVIMLGNAAAFLVVVASVAIFCWFNLKLINGQVDQSTYNASMAISAGIGVSAVFLFAQVQVLRVYIDIAKSLASIDRKIDAKGLS